MRLASAESARHFVTQLEPSTYRRHGLHDDTRAWPETNCYTDLVIEMVHAFGFEPLAMLPFTLAIDFERDQWTFFKPPARDLFELYGFDVQELAIWRPLAGHVEAEVAAGHPVLVEVDAFYLPDTAGTAYRLAHTKTTVGVNDIDVAARRMDYFHNAGYFRVEGEDFAELLQLDGAPGERVLPPYVEFVKWRDFNAPRGAALAQLSLESMRRQLARAPRANPFRRFKPRFTEDLAWLGGQDIAAFHAYAFANLRQFGACYELAASYLRWLAGHGIASLEAPAADMEAIAQSAKALQFQLARAIARRKPVDLAPLDAMADCWDRALPALRERFA